MYNRSWETAANHCQQELRDRGLWSCPCDDCQLARTRSFAGLTLGKCESCGAARRSFGGKYCSSACKQKAYRDRVRKGTRVSKGFDGGIGQKIRSSHPIHDRDKFVLLDSVCPKCGKCHQEPVPAYDVGNLGDDMVKGGKYRFWCDECVANLTGNPTAEWLKKIKAKRAELVR
jgi:hypothetical protein